MVAEGLALEKKNLETDFASVPERLQINKINRHD